MKEEHLFQNQHRISKVYLKQFGYKKDEDYWLSVLKIGDKITENVLIDKFTTEINIFDLPVDNFEIKRHFENLSSQVENFYRTVISNLQNQKMLTGKNKDVLNYFVANLLCRSNPFRDFLTALLNNNETRDRLIEEVTIFSNDSEGTRKFLTHFGKDIQLNIFIGYVMNHLVYVLSKFKKVIMRDYNNKGWITSDNPVYIDRQNNHQRLVPIEAEIFLPLSKEFCLFMYNPNSTINTNPLRKLRIDKVNTVSFETFEEISYKVARNYYEYLIFCTEIEPTIMLNDTTANNS